MTRPFLQNDAGRHLLRNELAQQIDHAIAESTETLAYYVDENRRDPDAVGGATLAVKYLPVKYAQTYAMAPNRGFYIGPNAYTWGRGVYVAGVQEPTSTAIYGRIGVVATYDPTAWRAFDARPPANRKLYVRWLQAQPAYEDAVLTVHSEHFLHQLRNRFREQFAIDVVMFHPDEADRHGWYTLPTDTWLAVSDWNPRLPGTLADGYSPTFHDCRLTVLADEEFDIDTPPTTRTPYLALHPGPRRQPGNAGMVRAAYAAGEVVRLLA